MFQIENEEIILKIASLGAEMKSLVDKQTAQEYLWHGVRHIGEERHRSYSHLLEDVKTMR